MATIWLARHVGAAGFERLVVIKRVHAHLLKDRAFHDMFRDEARVASLIHHPNVVPVIDVVEAEGELFLVLEYVESLSLGAFTRRASTQGHVESSIAVRVFADTLAGLHAAHEAVDLQGKSLEVIHRDVSPQNIIVGVDGTSRLIDFGIARAASRISVSHSGVLKGKLRYMSPEQVRQLPLDRRADVFAAGAVLYEVLTGKSLFRGEDDADIVIDVLMKEIRRPSELEPRVPGALDEVVLKALSRDRDERFPTAASFQEALEHALTPASPRAVAQALEELAGEELAERREAVRTAVRRISSKPKRRGSVRLVVGGAALLTAATLGAAFAARSLPRARIAPVAEASISSSSPPTSNPPSPPEPSSNVTTPVAVAASAPGHPPRHLSRPQPPAPPKASAPAPKPSSDLHRENPYGPP